MWRGGLPSTAVETVSDVPLLDENEHRAPGDLGDTADCSSKEPAENILKEPSVDPGNSPLLGDTEQTLAEVHLEQLRESLASDRSGKTSVEALVASALEELSGHERREYLRAMSRVVAEVDIALLDPILFQMGSIRDRNVVLREVVDSLRKQDPYSAVDWVMSLGENSGRGSAAEMLGRLWAGNDVQAAKAWVESLTPGSVELVKANEGLVWSWMQQDPGAVVDYANSMTDPVAQSRAHEKAAKVLAIQDPVAAVEWADGFPDDRQRRELVDYGVYRWAKEDPEAARSWVESATDPASRAGATGALVRAWADSAPGEATQWVMENRDTFESELPLLQSSRAWAEAEPAAAAAWLQGLDDAGLQKRIFDSITRVRANQGGNELKGWMEQVEDPGLVERANRIAQQAGRSGGGDR